MWYLYTKYNRNFAEDSLRREYMLCFVSQWIRLKETLVCELLPGIEEKLVALL